MAEFFPNVKLFDWMRARNPKKSPGFQGLYGVGRNNRGQVRLATHHFWHRCWPAVARAMTPSAPARQCGSRSRPMMMANAQNRARVFIEFMEKLGAPSIVSTIGTSRQRAPRCRRATITRRRRVCAQGRAGAHRHPAAVGQHLFSNPRFMHGAATSCNADVFAHAAVR